MRRVSCASIQAHRKASFDERLRTIKAHSADSTQTYKRGVNPLTDRTTGELSSLHGLDREVAARFGADLAAVADADAAAAAEWARRASDDAVLARAGTEPHGDFFVRSVRRACS